MILCDRFMEWNAEPWVYTSKLLRNPGLNSDCQLDLIYNNLGDKPLSISMREFLYRVIRGRKTHPDCGQHHHPWAEVLHWIKILGVRRWMSTGIRHFLLHDCRDIGINCFATSFHHQPHTPPHLPAAAFMNVTPCRNASPQTIGPH